MDINTWQLRCFMEVASCLNFTKAAVNLYIGQPALSQQIAELEKQLGVTLFHRTSRTVTLTPSGKLLLEFSVDWLNQLEGVRRRLLQIQSGVHGEMKIGYLCEPFKKELPKIIRTFYENYPGITLDFRTYRLGQMHNALKNRSIDIGFSFRLPLDEFNGKPVCSATIGHDDLCLVVNENHPFVQSCQSDFSLLSQDMLYILDDNMALGWSNIVQNACRIMQIAPQNHKIVNEVEAILLLIDASLGFSILPSSLSNCDLPHVRFIPIQDQSLERVVLWNKDIKNVSVPLFLEELANIFNTCELPEDLFHP